MEMSHLNPIKMILQFYLSWHENENLPHEIKYISHICRILYSQPDKRNDATLLFQFKLVH